MVVSEYYDSIVKNKELDEITAEPNISDDSEALNDNEVPETEKKDDWFFGLENDSSLTMSDK